EGITVHRRLSGDPRGNPQTEASHPKQFPQGIQGRVMKSVENSATSKRASEGSASEPSLARRVSMCKDAKLSCRGNRRDRDDSFCLGKMSRGVPETVRLIFRS